MDIIKAVQQIRNKFNETGSPATIPNFKGGIITARLVSEGVEVDKLGTQPFLHWSAFQEAVCVLIRNSGKARRGKAMNFRLGDPDLSLDSIEHLAVDKDYISSARQSIIRHLPTNTQNLFRSVILSADE